MQKSRDGALGVRGNSKAGSPVLPARHRMTFSRDFRAAVKGGRRMGRRSMVVYLTGPASVGASGSGFTGAEASFPCVPAVRVGLIVSKSVGNSVTRHAVSRRLRAAAQSVVTGLDDGSLLVIRALRASADDDTAELTGQLRSSLTKLGKL